MTEFVEHWENGKLKLIPKGKVSAANTGAPARVEDMSTRAIPDVCGPVRTQAGNVVGAPNIGAEERSTSHPWVDAVYRGAQAVKRRLWEREDARNAQDI